MQVVGIDTRRLSRDWIRTIEPLLSPVERRMSRALPMWSREQWLRGRLALKLAGGLYSRKPWFEVETSREPGGEPVILGGPGVRCSLSHSAHIALAAVARSPVGVDIELIRPRDSALLPYIAAADEVRLIQADDVEGDRGDTVTKIWTIKESALKSGGWGLSIPPRAARIVGRSWDGGLDIQIQWQAVDQTITVWSAPTRGCSLSIASHESNPLRRICWDPSIDVPSG